MQLRHWKKMKSLHWIEQLGVEYTFATLRLVFFLIVEEGRLDKILIWKILLNLW